MEKMPENFIWVALAISNVAAALTLLSAWKAPNLSRLLYFLLFAWASWANTRIALIRPEAYLEYGDFAFLPIYKKFIMGWFSTYGQTMVFCIAAGQALIALFMLAKGWLFNMGCVGGIVFFLGITPLGVGAGFPSSLLWALGLFLLYKKNIHQYLWSALFGKKAHSAQPTT